MSETTQHTLPRLRGLGVRIFATVLLATVLTATIVSGIAAYGAWSFLTAELERRAPLALARTAAELWEWSRTRSAALDEAVAAGTLDADQGVGFLASHADVTGVGWQAAGSDGIEWSGPGFRLHSNFSAPAEGWPALSLAVDAAGRHTLAFRTTTADGAWIAALDPETLDELLSARELGREAQVSFVAGHPAALPPAHRLTLEGERDGPWHVALSHPLGVTGLSLRFEQPFAVVFEPIASILVWVVAIDVWIVALFSWAAARNTRVVVRPIDALSQAARRISSGDLDVQVPVPEGGHELSLLARTFNHMTRGLARHQAEIEAVNVKLRAQNDELQQANEVLEQLSITDGLTKLHNHRYFQDFLTREIKRVSRTQDPLSILLIDIDDFKRLNDRRGHAAGDELLKGIAAILNDCVRETDLVARYGGEEFVVLAPNTAIEGATQLAEKVRMAVEEASFILDETMQITKLTVSVGVGAFAGDRKAFFRAADQALYRAKGAGKNCVVVDGHDEPVPVGSFSEEVDSEQTDSEGAPGDADALATAVPGPAIDSGAN